MPEDAQSPPEPSMEEIIASISRIITEDQRPSEPVRPVAAESGEILELTEAVNEDGSVRRLPPSTDNTRASVAASLGAPDLPGADPTARVEPELARSDAGPQARLEASRERILSSATSGAAAAAFAQLGALPRDRRKEGEFALGSTERTLEDIVRDMLRPLLQSWLDEHLPGIVERLVREEIARVMGEAGLR